MTDIFVLTTYLIGHIIAFKKIGQSGGEFLDSGEMMETIRDLIEKAAEKTPKKTFFILNDQEIAYEDFLLTVKRVANGFLSLGVRKGDRVAILLHNCVQFPYAWLAANMIGAVMVPVNARFVDKEALHVLNHSEAKVLATSEAHLGMIGNIRNQLPALETIISIDGQSENVLYFGDLLEASPDLERVAIDGQRDLAAILYTSGTTGTPKGCMATHDYYVNLAYMQADLFGLSSEDRVYTAQPFYYMDPQWNTLMAMTCNATVVVSEKFSTGRFWDEIRRRDITCFYCIGSMTSFLYNMPPSPLDKEHRLRVVQTSGISSRIHKAWEERFNVPVYEVYASTETTVDIAVPIGADRKAGTACIGRPVWYREARIVDDNDVEAPRGAVGEIALKRGRGMMLGYYKDEAATEEAFRGGWFHSGDLGYVDEDGDFHFAGRKKDIIRRGGENISAASIEHVLMTHPDILDAAAIPVPDRIRGEEVKVYVVPRPGGALTYEEILKFSEENLGAFKVPRYIEFRDSLPKTPSERVQKEKLKKERENLAEGCFDRLAAKREG
jgi:crotonobetaine/carnitine-CoA ligase